MADASGARGRFEDYALLWSLIGIVALLSVLPLARLLLEGVMPGGAVSGAAVRRVLSSNATWMATGHSLVTAFGGTALAVVLGGLVALTVSLTDVRGRNAFVFCYVMPLMLAPQVVALAWLQTFGPSSPFLKMLGMAPALGSRNPLYSPGGIILVLGVQYAPLVFLTLRAGLRTLPQELLEAALAGGAKPLRVIRTIVIPLMTPPLLAGVALCFVSCLGNFGIPALLGIPGNYLVLPTLIYQRLAGFGPAVLSDVAVLSVLIGMIAIIGIVVQDVMLSRRDFRTASAAVQARAFELRRWRQPVEIALWALAFLALVLPLTALVMTSLVPAVGVALNAASATLDNYRFVLFEHAAARRALRNSFGLSATAALAIVLITVPLAYFLVWRRSRLLRAVNVVTEVPYAVPGVVLAIAAILLFLKPLPVLGFSLYNTIWIILFCYLARFLVLGLRPVVSGYHQLDRTLEEAAQIVGARLLRRLVTVILPLVAPAAAAGALLIFLTAFNELTLSALLWSTGAETLGVVFFSFQQGGDSNYAAALGVLTIIVSVSLMLATLLLAGRFAKGGVAVARLTLECLGKSFGAFTALDDVSLAVDDGEFVAILGPSGCGKTTLLRQIAGFDRPSSGRILIGDTVVSTPERQMPPEERRIGIVFQSYALWPHMSVAENVAYGLTVAGVRDPERARRVDAALALVELEGFADRRPALLSGGQRQRVALARCLVTEPSLVLLDEPLANLDVHLRAAMEREFARFHERTGTTMIYITHDQTEAMALADRIAVMDKGRVLQFATPSQLYREPADATVAKFIGEGMVVPAQVVAVHGDACGAEIFGHRLRLRCDPAQAAIAAFACLRASALSIVPPGSSGLPAHVTAMTYQGGHFRVDASVAAQPEVALHLTVSEPSTLVPGADIELAIADGWVIPRSAEA